MVQPCEPFHTPGRLFPQCTLRQLISKERAAWKKDLSWAPATTFSNAWLHTGSSSVQLPKPPRNCKKRSALANCESWGSVAATRAGGRGLHNFLHNKGCLDYSCGFLHFSACGLLGTPLQMQLLFHRTICSRSGCSIQATLCGNSMSTTPSGKKRSVALQKLYDAHPPGSQRWRTWVCELQLVGLSDMGAVALLSRTPKLLECSGNGNAACFQKIFSLILSETNLGAKEVMHMAKQQPLIIKTSFEGVEQMVAWFKTELRFTSAELGSVLYRYPTAVLFRKAGLQARLDLLSGLHMTIADVKSCWLRTPSLLTVSCATLESRFSTIKSLFGHSELVVLEQIPNALLKRTSRFRERLLFLQHLRIPCPSLPDIDCCTGDDRFAKIKMNTHIQRSGSSLLQLCQELQLKPGMASVMQDAKLEPKNMTKLEYFQAFVMWLPTQPRN